MPNTEILSCYILPLYITKKRGTPLAAYPASKALALPKPVWISNTEAHADMYNIPHSTSVEILSGN